MQRWVCESQNKELKCVNFTYFRAILDFCVFAIYLCFFAVHCLRRTMLRQSSFRRKNSADLRSSHRFDPVFSAQKPIMKRNSGLQPKSEKTKQRANCKYGLKKLSFDGKIGAKSINRTININLLAKNNDIFCTDCVTMRLVLLFNLQAKRGSRDLEASPCFPQNEEDAI